MMKNSIVAAALCGAVFSAPAQAGQPIHESLVECAVLVDLLIGSETPADGNRMITFYVRAAEAMRREAEVRSDSSYVRQVSAQKTTLWQDRWDAGNWDNPANRGELTDWINYCFKLADHLALDLPE